MSDDDITPSSRLETTAAGGEVSSFENLDKQISALTEVVGGLASKVTKLRERLDAVESGHTGKAEESEAADEEKNQDQPAAWVVFTSPAAAEDRRNRTDGHDPNWTLDNFVAWYNLTYVGLPGSPATSIPQCWREHPGLAMEIATLAYSWRRANIGQTANVRDAQYWHHQWRPGFTSRLTEWVHTHCLDGRHRPAGAPARADRFTRQTETAEQDVGSHLSEQRSP